MFCLFIDLLITMGCIQIPFPIIHTVERQPPSLQSGRHPLHIKCRDFMIITLSLLKDGETQDVFDSIQKLACVNSIEQLYAYAYQPRIPFTANNGWKIYDPIKEYQRMGVDKITNMWRFTPINQDYKVVYIIYLFIYIYLLIFIIVLTYLSSYYGSTI